MLRFGLTAFVSLLVIVDPFGLLPLFGSLTAQMDAATRAGVLRRAVGIGLGVALFFLVAGRAFLGYLGIGFHAFSISGGILLFLTAMPMLFGHRGGLQAPEDGEAGAGTDCAIFPLAIPLLSGPGTLTSILLLAAQGDQSPTALGVIAAAILAVFALSWVVLTVGQKLLARIGEGATHVITRVMGIVLAGLAVQYVLNGVTTYVRELKP